MPQLIYDSKWKKVELVFLIEEKSVLFLAEILRIFYIFYELRSVIRNRGKVCPCLDM